MSRPLLLPSIQQPSRLAAAQLQQLLDSVHELGVPTVSILRHCSLPNGLNNSSVVSSVMLARAVEKAIEVTQQPLFGLLHGNRVPMAMRGFASQVFHAADTFADALSWILRYLNNYNLLGQLRCRHQDDTIVLEVHRQGAVPSIAGFTHHYLLATLTTLLRYLLSNSDEFTGVVRLREAPLTSGLHYEEYLQLPVQFNQDDNALCIPEYLLQLDIAEVSQIARRQAEIDCENQLASVSGQQDLATRLRSQLLHQQQFPALAVIADQLNSSPRTINRQMAELHTSYQQQLDSARRQLAIHFLSASDDSIDAIASRLGYNDASNFGRAFRRWLGMSPRQFRQLQRL
ncbi:hypothetical protein CHH28_12115 [Bacterioplanes sanyensis]|uniref:HTH araC/xylS-type domain-containing protein n=1 Tax=Bacterioplanes sanyensis TaxID=1249553 RepID=A0A222FLV9_9GAMM|nr:helix-turn-helix domain-containing protein [Bacterioplanes sanyensis]ASP39371.1 hypothetical protein CHH28_12115 [Bacterioplanes sanyensis]